MNRFSRKQVVIAVVAVAALLYQWPPYFRYPGPTDQIGFNEDFWAVAGLEVFIFVVVALTRKADSLRRALDDPSPQSEAAPTPPRYRRRWPRFSLRTLFAVVTLLVIVLGFVSALVGRINRDRRAVDSIIKLGGEVFYRQATPGIRLSVAPPRRHWSIRWLVDDDAFANVAGVRIKGGDDALTLLKHFPNIETVALYGDGFTTQALDDVADLSSLGHFELDFCSITAQELAHSSIAPRLHTLAIYGGIDDAGLQELQTLGQLTALSVGGQAVSEDAVVRLEKEMPQCRVVRVTPIGGWNLGGTSRP